MPQALAGQRATIKRVTALARTWPKIVITDETMREGMQIESVTITLDQKLQLLDALSETGLKRIVVGSFVSPKWTPQMAEIDLLIQRLRPRPGVTYLALALNERGRERRRHFAPPLSVEDDVPETHQHLCDIFIKRNTNRTIAEQEATWPRIVEQAVDSGATAAGVGLSAAWGSNWRGEFSHAYRMEQLERQVRLWSTVGIPVRKVFLADPMGWNTPDRVAEDLEAIKRHWPTIATFALHLHNQRGLAMTSSYVAMQTLEPQDTLMLDTTLGGIGGCPYCGNGRVAGMVPTEDMVQLLERLGIRTGVDLYQLVEAVALASDIIGRPLDGHVSKAGPFPNGERLYPVSVPAVETADQAQHFRLGPDVYAGQPCPWEPASAQVS
jgi:hydroxymethylglutaryl-CoA lyase